MRLIILALSSLIYSSQGFTTGDTDPLNLNWIDKKTPIQQNFYAYANGSWQRQHPIPADYASWSVFHELYEKNNGYYNISSFERTLKNRGFH